MYLFGGIGIAFPLEVIHYILDPQDKKIMEKVYGKQKVYVVNQELFPKVEETGIKNMDAK